MLVPYEMQRVSRRVRQRCPLILMAGIRELSIQRGKALGLRHRPQIVSAEGGLTLTWRAATRGWNILGQKGALCAISHLSCHWLP